ncbi:RsmE family RNA methyltransferase [Chondromyces apiculatus]|uniref:Ribosomal RNA small subunit methyltransferase E n=1 Tax=Chondromyces apiculatus DSM 436 TaxID=1192034 RepID=A0A017TED6_9BACT|nr:RsmE family RNA methyltransferase [Chondromyces apiculatus]EYF07185.1 Ribosomal RNA small subunit methyltransferase E [Chondromyces apiculatus DSM 436]
MKQALLRVPLAPLFAGVVPLSPETARYVSRVHRLREGERFLAFDPAQALEGEATLVEVGKGALAARIASVHPASLVPRRPVTLIQCVGKGDKVDAVIRDATELGASRVIAALSARCVARPQADRGARWRRIAVEAARQCGRGDVPRVEGPLPLVDALHAVHGAAGACLDPRGALSFGRWVGEVTRVGEVMREVALVVGPEGGFTDEETAACEDAGFARVKLGSMTLRTETVCAAALGALLALTDA